MTNKPSNIGTCKLCLQARPLQYSHIIPEFFYRKVYEKGKLLVLGDGLSTAPTLQKGYRERLLCRDCEKHLNRNIEQPYEKELLDGIWENAELVYPSERLETRITRDLNYAVLKLMHLSILWRSAAMNGRGFFPKNNLGPHYERLRQMLLTLDPGGATDYGLMVFHIQFDGEPSVGMTMPISRRMRGKRAYAYFLNNYYFLIYVTSTQLSYIEKFWILKENGILPITQMELDRFDGFKKLQSICNSTNLPKWAKDV